MKVLGLGVSVVLLGGLVLLTLVIFSGRSKEAQQGNILVGASTIYPYETPSLTTSSPITSSTDMPDIPDTPQTMITGTTDIPLYPGAGQVESVEGPYYDKPGGGEYTLRSNSSIKEIVSFYKRELAKSGWTVEAEDSSATGASIDFSWVNPVKEIPIRRHLNVTVTAYATDAKSLFTGVTLRFERWPDPNYVPLYPDVQKVQVERVDNPDPQINTFERVTTYESKASIEEIEAYYKDAMVQSGWVMGKSEPPTHLFFSYRHDLPCPAGSRAMWCGTGSLVDIFIYPQESGITKVELRVPPEYSP